MLRAVRLKSVLQGRCKRCLAAWLLALVAPHTLAAQFIEWQGHEIHYTSFSSMLIPAETAALHDIKRAKNRIVTNISLRRDGKPVAAQVSGTATNLLNQQSQLDFTEVTEQTAIYYLANQLVSERDTLRLSIRIQPQGLDEAYLLEYVRDYYQ